MNNELIVENSWWKRNWKWFLPISTVIFLLGITSILSINGNSSDIFQAYSDDSLYYNALYKAKKNERLIEVIGEIQPLDKLSIIEGDAVYSNDNNSVAVTVRIKGSKGKGKMDIIADKKNTKWEYKKINIRIKEPKEEIQILD